MEKNSLKQDIENLKESTVKLGRQLSEVSKEHWAENKKHGENPDGIFSEENRRFKHLRGRVSELANDAAKQTRKVHESIRDKPYLFLAGTLGIGIVLGKFLDWKRRRN